MVRIGMRWLLKGGSSGWFDGGRFCQLRVYEQSSLRLEEREDNTDV